MRPPQLAAALLTIASVAAPVQTLAAGPDVAEATLDNGLRVLVLEDHRSPIVSVQVWYRVGSRNERPGATGLAHFLEHMMFKGTPTHGKGEFSRLVEQNGGQDNAFTSQDVTSYYVDIAADKVDLALSLEADRMRNLLLDPKEIDSERQVVMEERRTRTEDDPDGLVSEEMMSLAFKAHPYRWPVIGWMEDIRRIAPAELRAFYDTYYRPNNAILVVVGDVAAPEILGRVRRLFGGIARGPEPPPVAAIEPPQIDERRLVVKKPGAQVPIVNVSWHVPNFRSADAPALDLLSTILSEGRASRLYRKLTYERRLALGAGGDYSYFSLDPNLFWLYATPLPGQTPEVIEQALLARGRAGEGVADPRGGDRAGEEPGRGELRLAPRFRALARVGPGPLRAAGFVAALGGLRAAGPGYHRRRSPAGGARVLPHRPEERRHLVARGARGAVREVTTPVRRILAAVPLLLVGTLPSAGVAVPLAHREVLPSGARLLVAPRPAIPIVVVRVYVRAGSVFDPPDAAGLANLTAELLTRGTAARTGPELDRAIEFVGGSLESESGRDGSTLTLAVLRKDLDLGLDLLAEALLRPTFPEDELRRKVSDIQAAIQRSEENPEAVGGRALARLLYPGHPYAHPVTGTAESVGKLTREHVVRFHRARYRPDATVIAVVGDVGVDEIRQALSRRLSGWTAPASLDGPIPMAPPSPPVVAETISRELTQATVYLGRPAIRQDHPDYFPLLVANYILGGGSASRLYTRVREDAGLAYAVGSALSPGRYGAACTVSLQTRVDGVAEALRLVKDEMAAMGRAPVEERELGLAKSYLIGSFPLRLDTSVKVAETLTAIEEYDLGLDYPDRFNRRSPG